MLRFILRLFVLGFALRLFVLRFALRLLVLGFTLRLLALVFTLRLLVRGVKGEPGGEGMVVDPKQALVRALVAI